MIYHERLRKLRPDFDDCPEPCAQAEEQGETIYLPDFCATCEVKKQFDFFRAGLESELEKHFAGAEIEFSFQSLVADVNRVRRMDRAVRGKGYPRGADALTVDCLDLLRNEEYRPSRIARWEFEQRPKDGG